ncbi:MAG: DUF3311 domain-containing protein [Calditrichia bacterium]
MSIRSVLILFLGLFYFLRIDLWWWQDSSRLLGLPIGLTYQIGFCFAVSALFYLIVTYAWPTDLDDDEEMPS